MLMRECVDAAPENESYRLGLAFALLHTDGRDEAAEAGNLIGAVLGTTRHPLTKARAQAMLGDREGLVRTLSRMKEDGNMAGLVMVGRLAEFEPYLADPEFNAVLED
jgi:hypothetical protein